MAKHVSKGILAQDTMSHRLIIIWIKLIILRQKIRKIKHIYHIMIGSDDS